MSFQFSLVALFSFQTMANMTVWWPQNTLFAYVICSLRERLDSQWVLLWNILNISLTVWRVMPHRHRFEILTLFYILHDCITEVSDYFSLNYLFFIFHTARNQTQALSFIIKSCLSQIQKKEMVQYMYIIVKAMKQSIVSISTMSNDIKWKPPKGSNLNTSKDKSQINLIPFTIPLVNSVIF